MTSLTRHWNVIGLTMWRLAALEQQSCPGIDKTTVRDDGKRRIRRDEVDRLVENVLGSDAQDAHSLGQPAIQKEVRGPRALSPRKFRESLVNGKCSLLPDVGCGNSDGQPVGIEEPERERDEIGRASCR